MEIKQFLGISWKEFEPSFVFFNNENKCFEELKCEDNVDIVILDEKRCLGYYDLSKKERISCKEYKDLTGKEYSQCNECKNNSGFSMCLGCTGDDCRSNNYKALEFCSEEHFVYLAYFSKGKLKVGTAAGYRKYERLLEQGAIYSIFLAKTPNGKIARRIENNIASLGIVTRVSSTYKMNNLIISKSKNEVEKMLLKEYSRIELEVDKWLKDFLISPVFNSFESIANTINSSLLEERKQLTLFGEIELFECKKYNQVENPKKIQGVIKALVGNILLVENNGEYSAFNMKNLEGRIVRFNE